MIDEHESTLRRLVAEAKREQTPAIDYDRIEKSLLARVAREPAGASTITPRGSAKRWAIAALVCAASAGAFALGRSKHVLTMPPTEQASRTTSGEVDGDALAVGAVVTSGATPVVVTHKDHVTWQLAPDGVARVEASGAIVGIALERGTISAHVTKSPLPESFAVRVEHTRVAVHGTRFTVVRLERTVRVVVDEGVVAVGPLEGPSFEVRAPGSTEVTFEGVREDAAKSGTGSTEEAAPAQPTPAASGKPKTAAARTDGGNIASLRTPDASAVPNVERVITAVRHCLAANTVARGDLRVSVRTRMSLRVRANGHVGEALFDPPLAPQVQSCVDAEVGAIAFGASRDGFAIEKVIELDR